MPLPAHWTVRFPTTCLFPSHCNSRGNKIRTKYMVHKAWPKWLKQEMSPGGYQPSFTDFKINIQEWNPLQMSHYERHHKFLLHPLLLLSILAFREKKRVNSAYGFSIGGQSFCFWLVNESAEAWSTYWTQIQLVSQIVLWYHLITWTTWNFLGCFYQQQRNTGKQNPCKQWILPPLRGQKTKCNGLRVWPTLNSQQFRFSCPLQITLFRWSKNIPYTPTWKFLLAGDYSLNFLKKKSIETWQTSLSKVKHSITQLHGNASHFLY